MNLRDPLPDAAVRVVMMAPGGAEKAEEIGEGIVRLLGQRGRKASMIVVRPDVHGWNVALDQAMAEGDEPLVLVSTATTPWAAGHLDPILKAIDGRDHVIGRRPRRGITALLRWVAMLPTWAIFAVPVLDRFSPVRLHRRAAIAKFPYQSATRFLEVEILAKATFFVQTIEEVAVPDLESPEVGPMGHDLQALFRHPVLTHPKPAPVELGPAESLESPGEGADGPGAEDEQGHPNNAVAQPSPLQHDPAQGLE